MAKRRGEERREGWGSGFEELQTHRVENKSSKLIRSRSGVSHFL